MHVIDEHASAHVLFFFTRGIVVQYLAPHAPNGEPKVSHKPMPCMVIRCQAEALSVGVVEAKTVSVRNSVRKARPCGL